jgi:hypothetical protein
MITITQQIQDLAQVISRLGRYVENHYAGPTVIKDKGLVQMLFWPTAAAKLVCKLSDGTVWKEDHYIADSTKSDNLSATDALLELQVFHKELLEKATLVAKEEILQELVAKKLRRITRPKTRGFKADLKKKKSK